MKKILFALLIYCTAVSFGQDQEKDQGSQDQQQTQKISRPQLIQPITVTVGGNFFVTGTFDASAAERVDAFVSRLIALAPRQTVTNIYPLRQIKLIRRNGEQLKIDLLKFRFTGNFKNNPYLMNDDVLVFPGFDYYDERNIIDISGAVNGSVNSSVKFQYAEGDKLSDAILFAGGINQAYENVDSAEISRLTEKGEKEEVIKVPLSNDIPLNRGDRVRILFNENNRKAYKVLILGEVNQPGYVYITKDNSTIKEVIQKAGGFTDKAWLERSDLIRGNSEANILKTNALRQMFSKEENYRTFYTEKYMNTVNLEQMKFLRMNDQFAEDSLTVVLDNMLRVLQNKSIIDFSKVLSDTSSDSKFIVRNDDIIVVPQKEDLVYVFGQVNNPGFVKYEPQKKHEYYIEKAGGLGKRAENDVKLIKGTSYAWVNDDENAKIEPGDFIYIPKNVPRPFDFYLRSIGSVAQILTTLATIILVAIQLKK
jgi:protein involved in polysaccharide export with SLBB domain